ncbi:hypothetical protein A249_22914 [Pseudomonas syringae pv. actinidiae ICMP 18804]|nr:hypothetical protein A249_22914 [Pseudomonas syringae pv. actinidiae ICMP 18804]
MTDAHATDALLGARKTAGNKLGGCQRSREAKCSLQHSNFYLQDSVFIRDGNSFAGNLLEPLSSFTSDF